MTEDSLNIEPTGMAALVAAWQRLQAKQRTAAIAALVFETVSATDSVGLTIGDAATAMEIKGQKPDVINSEQLVHLPELLIPAAIVVTGGGVAEGQLIEAVAISWFEIVKELQQNPQFPHQLNWRKVEELIAGAYVREGWPEVVLTPRSADGGRDVIASKPGIGAIRFYDQVKAYAPRHRVPANDVRALVGVLNIHPNVSKAVITTTAAFAPGIHEEMKDLIPYRLELRDGRNLNEWLIRLRGDGPSGSSPT